MRTGAAPFAVATGGASSSPGPKLTLVVPTGAAPLVMLALTLAVASKEVGSSDLKEGALTSGVVAVDDATGATSSLATRMSANIGSADAVGSGPTSSK